MPESSPATETRRERSAALPLPRAFRPRGGPVRKSKRSRWRAFSLIAVHVAVLIHVAHWKIAGETITPVEPSEAMQTLELGYVNAGFLLFIALIVLTAVLGRFFCGWACHLVAYQDLCAWLLGRFGVRPRPLRSRILMLAPFGLAFMMFILPTLSRIVGGDPAPTYTWHLTTTSFWETFPGLGISLLTFAVCGFLIVYWLGSKGFCTYGCPYGAFFALGDRAATGRIRVTDDCETCGHCTATCTSNVQVHREVAQFGMVVDPGCMKCMDCVSVCPKNALYFGLGRVPAPKLIKRRFDFSWGEEIAMLFVGVWAFFAFRSLYGLIPLLLAGGLAVITAVGAVAGWRLLRRKDFAFQHRTLKVDGRWTTAGRVAALILVVWLGVAIDSAVVNVSYASGEIHADAGADRSLAPTQRKESLDTSLARLETAERWGLLPDPRLQKTIGLVLRERGDFDAAEQRFRRALEIQPNYAAAAIPLTDLLMIRGARGEAEQILRDVLRERPDYAPALRRMQRLHPRQGR